MKNTNALSQEFKSYNEMMAKLGVYGSTLDELNNGEFTITLTTKTWYSENSKNFSKNPQSTKTEVITDRQYACYITSVGFFHDRINRAYLPVGYIPVRLTCYSPDRSIKIQRSFKITLNEKPPWD